MSLGDDYKYSPPEDRIMFEKVCRNIGEAAFKDKDVALFQGDSLQIMKAIPRGSVDLVLTSPPYNIGKEYETIKPIGDYVAWTEQWFAEAESALADEGALWVNLGYIKLPDRGKAVPLTYLLWDKTKLHLIQEIVWNYGAGVASRHSFSPRNEKFLWYVKNPASYYFDLDSVRDPNVKYPNQKKNGKLRCNPLGKNPTDVWQIPKVTSGHNRSSKERTGHPAQFPIEVLKRIILACSRPGGLILDPFVGSGSTLVAAKLLGRKAIGIEIEPRYIDYARKRLGSPDVSLFAKRSARRKDDELACGDLFVD